MAHARRGRPRKAGARNAKGRLVVLPDRGNVVVQARAARFARFQDGKAGEQLADQIGRAWAAGLLDGQNCDAAILRDMGRLYASLYWQEYAALAPKTAAWERRDPGIGANTGADRSGERFKVLDAIARSAGRDAMIALEELTVNTWWFPDSDTLWVARLIDHAAAERGDRSPGVKVEAGDRAKLAAASQALLAMVEGGSRR